MTTEQTGSSSALLVFSVGPVQDFIATARRTQDLWMGSYILSYLAAAAMREIARIPGSTPEQYDLDRILFPTLDGQPLIKKLWLKERMSDEELRQLTLATLPNKFTALVDSREHRNGLTGQAEQAVYAAWDELANQVADKFPKGIAETVTQAWQNLWKEQADPHRWVEMYWVVCPYDAAAHGESTRRAEQALEARKRLRDFGPADERGEKCTVCGIRAALGSEPDLRRSVLREEWGQLADELHQLGESNNNTYKGLAAALNGKGNERLCAICAGKRFAQRFFFEDKLGLHGGFPSTSSIASAFFRKELMRDEMRAARQSFTRALDGIIPRTLAEDAFPALAQDDLQRYDGDLFYPDTYTAKRLVDDYGVQLNEAGLGQLRGAVQALRSAARQAQDKIRMPPTYYAVLVMDGDHMGEHLRAAETIQQHRDISDSLRDFALNQVQTIVENQDHLGRVVYAGGDDVMAFLPLDSILSAAHKLAQAFFETTHGFTASAGIAIAHHLAPLDTVLAAAREVEERAKDKYGRNAIVFTVLKRSGEQLDVGARWQYDGLKTLKLIADMRDRFRDDRLSAKFAFDAEAEARALARVDKQTHEKMLARLIKRHAPSGDDDLAKQLAELGEGLRNQPLPKETSATLETARWLLLARFLAQAGAGEE